MASVAEIIRRRASVRTYEDRPLTTADRQDLENYLAHIDTPFGAPVTFRLLDADTHGLRSPVIVGAHAYVAAKVPRTEGAELSCGYAFECFCLYATARRLGSVMLAASLGRRAFERAMEVANDEVMPIASPVGYPAEKRSMREELMRKALGADDRLPFETLFSADVFGEPLSPGMAGAFAEPLELVRLAPSATNRQPWRAVVNRRVVHFYETRTIREGALGDIQKVDMGIALAHFDLSRRELGIHGDYVTRDPKFRVPANTIYVTSFVATR